jgi:hypothetical protein
VANRLKSPGDPHPGGRPTPLDVSPQRRVGVRLASVATRVSVAAPGARPPSRLYGWRFWLREEDVEEDLEEDVVEDDKEEEKEEEEEEEEEGCAWAAYQRLRVDYRFVSIAPPRF